MDIKQKYYTLLFLGTIFSSGVILFDHLIKENPQESLERAFDELDQQYINDSIKVVNDYLLGGEVVSSIENSPFAITISSKNDSLIYWNIASASKEEGYASHYKKSFEFNDYKVEFTLDLFQGNQLKLKSVLQKEYHPQYDYYYNQNGKIVLPYVDNPIKLSISSRYINSKWHNYLLLIWFASLLMLGFFILYIYKQTNYLGKGLASWGLYNLFIITFSIAGGYFATNYLFGAHFLAGIYSSSSHFISLLTFTSLLLFLLLLVEGINKSSVMDRWLKLHDFLRYFVGSLMINGLMFFLILQAERFIMNGGVIINIEEVLNLNFTSIYFILLLMGYCIIYYYLSALLYRYDHENNSKIWQRIAGHTIGLTVIAIIFLWQGIETPIVPIVLFLVAYFLIHDLYEEFNARNLTYVLINVILFAGFLSVVIFYSALRKDKLDRKEEMKEVFTFLSEQEKQIVTNIRDSLIQSNLGPSIASLSFPSPMESLSFTSPMDRTELMVYIKDIIDKGDTTHTYSLVGLECYDQFGNSLFFNHISNFQANNALISNSQKIGEMIYHLPLRSLTSIFFQIENNDFLNSPINMIIKLSKTANKLEYNLEDKNYLIYKNNNLIYSFSNDFLDINKIDPASLEEDIDIGEMSYVVYSPGNGYKIIDYHEVAGLIKPISFFSMIFVVSGLLIVLLTLFNSRWNFLPKELNFKFYNQASLRSKIQLSVILLIIFSFFVIGVITTVYFKNIVSSNDRSKFKSELKTIINDVNNKLTETIDSESASNIIAQEFSELENIYDRRFAYYDQKGELVIKSDEYKNVFGRLPYTVLQSLANSGLKSLKSVSQQISEEQVLIPIYLTRPNPIGYLTMNYSSDKNISNGIFNHLGNLLNVYIFLFFLAGALSIFIANSITEPLAKLREGVKKFKLGRTNEPLLYESSDELGVLIQEYNAMTKKLDKSAQIIAKTERDMAWREMAKQVAHEIKNPLTPMKLHIQHLENAVRSSPERAQEMIKKVSSTLIEQINNLSNIASEFSNYATLPKAENHKTGLNEVVEHVHDLFRERDDMDIYMNEPIDDLIVFADRNHLVRILVNIIKNAIQSIPQDRRGQVDIELTKVEDTAMIIISDNGIGIPEHMNDKIFTPNFTTKSSGTGLGLAICVNMLDTMNGKIYFESKENIGTKFFIEIPIMRSDQHAGENDVIFLD